MHAGESSGPGGVVDALDLLHAERIDHGVRAVEDPALVRRLADEAVPLGVCATSNLTLGLYDSLVDHPLAALRDAGVTVTLNTDDPVAVGTTVEQEWHRAAVAYGWGVAELLDLARASFRASFADEDLIASALGELDATDGTLIGSVA